MNECEACGPTEEEVEDFHGHALCGPCAEEAERDACVSNCRDASECTCTPGYKRDRAQRLAHAMREE